MQTTARKWTPLLIAGAVALAVAIFFLGRSSGVTRTPTSAGMPSEKGHDEEGHEEHGKDEKGHGEEGVVEFDEESLRLANLKVSPVSYRPVAGRLAVTGVVEPNLTGVTRITARVTGKITSVAVNVGANAKTGQVLGTLTSTELASAQAAYRQAGSRVALARNHLQRQKQLAALGEFGRHKVEESRGTDMTAQGEVNRLQSELAAAKTEILEARSDLAARKGELAGEQAEVASGKSEIADARSQIKTAQAALAQAEAQAKFSQSRLARVQKLQASGIASRQQVEEALADFERAQAGVSAAGANIAQAEAKVETAEAHVQAAREKANAAQARVEEASAKIDSARARQKQVEASLSTAGKRAALALQSLNREERVYKGGYFTTKEVVEAEAQVRQARLEQEAAGNTIRLLGGRPGGGDTVSINAPIGGRVTERMVTLGETVTPEKELFTIVNLNSVWVQLNIYQKDLPTVRAGQPVTVTSDTAPGRTFTGTVSYVGDAVVETTRTLKVRAVIANIGNALRPQTFVRGNIATGVRAQAIAVPREAVQTLEGKTVVFVQGDHPGEFSAKPVVVGETVGGQTVITSGLEPGARVVIQGAFTVKAQAMKAELGHSH